MNLGEKIRIARLEKHMTQSDVAGDKITRNMLSSIESGKALPSLDTLLYIADKLELSITYLVSDDIDTFLYKKSAIISDVKAAFAEKRYTSCIFLIERMDELDDELAYIYALANFEVGVSAVKNGAFMTAEKHFLLAEEYTKKTIYHTGSVNYRIPLYMSFIKNVNAPLLEFDKELFFERMSNETDYEFFKYLTNDWEYPYKNQLFKCHASAKLKIKERKYSEAIELLLQITKSKSDFEYNAYLMYMVYGDLDSCYKQILDFENAYKYISKRLSMLEGFNS